MVGAWGRLEPWDQPEQSFHQIDSPELVRHQTDDLHTNFRCYIPLLVAQSSRQSLIPEPDLDHQRVMDISALYPACPASAVEEHRMILPRPQEPRRWSLPVYNLRYYRKGLLTEPHLPESEGQT